MRVQTWLLIPSLFCIVACVNGRNWLSTQITETTSSLTMERSQRDVTIQRAARAQQLLQSLPVNTIEAPTYALLAARSTIANAATEALVTAELDVSVKSNLPMKDLTGVFKTTSAGIMLATLPITGSYSDLAMLMQFIDKLQGSNLGITDMTITGNKFTANVVVAAKA